MKVLVADDSLAFRQLLQDTLPRWGYDVVTAADGRAAWDLLQAENAPRLALLDWVMPGLDGAEICRALRRRADGPYTYLLMLTARADREDVVGGLDAGADDYLVKPVDVHELRARLRAGRRIVELQQGLLAAQEALRHQATHDALTGVRNRAAALDALERELSRRQRGGNPVGVILADVDHFKRINDTRGHLAGDAVLRAVSRRLATDLRPYDVLGRYGGEEFVAVLPDCGAGDALQLAERLRQRVAEAPLGVPEGLVPVTVSVGAASSEGLDGVAAEALLRAADAALYRAKAAGRNRAELGVPAGAGGFTPVRAAVG